MHMVAKAYQKKCDIVSEYDLCLGVTDSYPIALLQGFLRLHGACSLTNRTLCSIMQLDNVAFQ